MTSTLTVWVLTGFFLTASPYSKDPGLYEQVFATRSACEAKVILLAAEVGSKNMDGFSCDELPVVQETKGNKG